MAKKEAPAKDKKAKSSDKGGPVREAKKAKYSKAITARKAAAPVKAGKDGRLRGNDLVRKIVEKPQNMEISEFRAGDMVNVYVKVREGEKERVQVFKGTVLKLGGAGPTRSFTVRKISAGVGVERTFPFSSPILDRVEKLNTGKVRRSKLYYLRSLEGKAAKIESELVSSSSAQDTEAPAAE